MQTIWDYAKFAVGMGVALAWMILLAKLYRYLLEKTRFYKFLMEKIFGRGNSN